MKRGFGHGVAVLSVAVCAIGWNVLATANAPDLPVDVKRFHAFLGKWHGSGELQETGQAAMPLKLAAACNEVASGFGVSCSLKAKGKDMQSEEADLMGVDPVTGKAHWYAITNMGETHDHLVEWQDDHSFRARYAWTQDGKQMEETITVSFAPGNKMQFRSVTSADGQAAVTFSGTLTR